MRAVVLEREKRQQRSVHAGRSQKQKNMLGNVMWLQRYVQAAYRNSQAKKRHEATTWSVNVNRITTELVNSEHV